MAGGAGANSSVDAADVARFERLGDDWWAPKGSMAALHKMNPVRIEYLRDHMCTHFVCPDGGLRDPLKARPLAGLRILDVGCGGGILCEPMARLGAIVTGIDPAPGNVRIAGKHAEDGGLSIDYRAVTAEDLAASGASFDVVLAMEVVEHVNDMPAFVAICASLVRPGGLMFAATLNRTLKSFALAIVGAEYVLRWVPKGTHQWEKFVTPRELEDALATGGVDVFDMTGVVYNPLRDAWSRGRDRDVNYMLVGRRGA